MTTQSTQKNEPTNATNSPANASEVPLLGEAAVARHRDAAIGLPAESVQSPRVAARLAIANAAVGVAAVLACEARIAAECPSLSINVIRETPSIARAFGFLSAAVNRSPQATELAQRVPEGYGLRNKLLSTAVALSSSGLIPAREVAAIQRGTGKIDMAEDLEQLAALFHRHEAAIQGKHPITSADLDHATSLGAQLLGLLKPSGVVKDTRPSAEIAETVELRDRFFTLLVNHYEEVWKAGAHLWGRSVDDHVPPLARRTSTRRAPEANPLAPVAQPAAVQ